MKAKKVIETLNEDFKRYDPNEYSGEIKEIIDEMSLQSKILFLEQYYQQVVDRSVIINNPEEIDSVLAKDLLDGKYDITDVMEFFEPNDDDENLAY